MHSDPIADLLTRIRNGHKAHHQSVTIPYSTIKEGILAIIKAKGFIESYSVNEVRAGIKEIEVTFGEGAKQMHLKRVSKPGQRIYIKKADLKPIKSGLGFTIISTSKGLMTNGEAYSKNLGGELICEIY